MKRLATLALLASACSSPPTLPSVAEVQTGNPVLFRDVTVFDGEAIVEHRDVIVQGPTIESVRETGAAAPSDALVIDGRGRTLLPGLVDSHAHFMSAGEKGVPPPKPADIAQAFLFAGVTTVLVAAGFDEVTDLARDRADGRAVAPHLHYAGPGLTAPGGHPIPLLRAMLPWPISTLATRSIVTAGSPEEARAAVRRVAEELHPPLFKIIFDDLPPGIAPHLDVDTLKAAIDEARNNGMRPIVHTSLSVDAVTAAEAGAALLVHIPQRDILTDTQVERLLATGVPFVSTVRLISASHEIASDGPSDLEREMFSASLLEPWLEDPAWDLAGFSEEVDARWEEVRGFTQTNFEKLHAAGVRIFVGTDSGVHGVFPGASLHHEIRMLVGLGMRPIDALAAVTSAPADFLDPSGSFGRIAAGQRADLMLVRGDPSVDIDALSEIEEVLLDGIRLSREQVGSR